MRGEKALKSVTFTFEDGAALVLEGERLEMWEALCDMKSDYLLPGNETHVLASNGLVSGFVPPEAIR